MIIKAVPLLYSRVFACNDMKHRRRVTIAIKRMIIDIVSARMHRVAQHADDHSSSNCCSSDDLQVSSSSSSSESESAEPSSSMFVQSTLAIHSGIDQPT